MTLENFLKKTVSYWGCEVFKSGMKVDAFTNSPEKAQQYKDCKVTSFGAEDSAIFIIINL